MTVMPISKIDNKTLRQKVYEQLRESILSAEMEPGESFSLRQLADSLGVSIMPVREALWQLETEKIIVIESNRKMSINILSPSEINEIFDLRLIHESRLVEASCLNKTKKVMDRLEFLLEKMKESNTKNKNYLHWNKDFHFVIYNNASLPITLSIVNNLWLRLAPYFGVREPGTHIFANIEPHAEMVRAFSNGDYETCIKGLKEDLLETREYILNHI
jgi:DNA-binding GntR family transcriptional regulator